MEKSFQFNFYRFSYNRLRTDRNDQDKLIYCKYIEFFILIESIKINQNQSKWKNVCSNF